MAFLQLSREPVVPGQSVLALSLHPARPRDAESFQAPREDRSPSQVLAYDSTRLEESAAPADVFLLSHPVDLGQSGSPVLAVSTGSAEVGPVVGLIEGRWLRPVSTSLMKKSRPSGVPGAALPIRYAIDLLDQRGIAWQSSSAPPP